MRCEEVNLFVVNQCVEEIPIAINQLRVSLHPQKQSHGPFPLFTDKPLIDISQARKNLNRELSNLLILANKPRFDRIEARLCIFLICFIDTFKFPTVFVQQLSLIHI